MKRIVTTLAAAGLVAAFAAPSSAYEAFHGPLGVLQNNPGATDGYVLIAPQDSKSVYLIDNDGNVVNEWKSEYNNFYAELLPNGNMVKHARIPDAKPGVFGGTSGLVEEFDWNGKKVWEYKMYTPGKEVSHHTFEVKPNGNMLLLGWEYKSYDDAVAKGMDPNFGGRCLFKDGIKLGKEHVDGIWPDFIREVDHNGNTVWEWHVWDHIGTGPDQIDINKFIPPVMSRAYAGPDWTHFNGVAYNPRTDQICVTSRNLAEVYVIDKKTGKITYRWGNPANYGAGKAPAGYSDDGDQQLFGPHAPDWTADDTITILDNGNNRPSGNYTRGVEIDPKTDKVVWFWGPGAVGAPGGNFYSAYQCGAQKQANGNWMITTTNNGHVVEVTPDKNIVWEYLNPISQDTVYKTSNNHGKGGGSIHKALRYAKDWPGFAGKELKPVSQLPNWTQILSEGSAPMPKK